MFNYLYLYQSQKTLPSTNLLLKAASGMFVHNGETTTYVFGETTTYNGSATDDSLGDIHSTFTKIKVKVPFYSGQFTVRAF